jgi:hypothetical protein
VGRRSRRRQQDERQAPASTTDYQDADGNVLTLRDELSAGTLRKLAGEGGSASASADDLWQRRGELMFERLAVSWTIAGAEPIERQKELLARYRFASGAERTWIRGVLREHLTEWFPDVEAP